MMSPWKGHLPLGLTRGQEHRRQRRVLAPSTSLASLRTQEQIVQYYAESLMEKLRVRSRRGDEVNLSDWCTLTLQREEDFY
jgi:cytochrome P450